MQIVLYNFVRKQFNVSSDSISTLCCFQGAVRGLPRNIQYYTATLSLCQALFLSFLKIFFSAGRTGRISERSINIPKQTPFVNGYFNKITIFFLPFCHIFTSFSRGISFPNIKKTTPLILLSEAWSLRMGKLYSFDFLINSFLIAVVHKDTVDLKSEIRS